jgi:TRAP-type C4-dicarboxylate transport system substrate-binding protein
MRPKGRPLGSALGPGGELPDVFDATLLDAAAASFDRAAQHVTLSRHALHTLIVVYSARWFDGLPEDLQAQLGELPRQLAVDARRAQREAEPRMLQRLARLGIEVHEHDGKQRRAFARATRPVIERLQRELGPEARALLSTAR